MTGYVLSVAADLDLDEIWEYIAADNIGAAVTQGSRDIPVFLRPRLH